MDQTAEHDTVYSYTLPVYRIIIKYLVTQDEYVYNCCPWLLGIDNLFFFLWSLWFFKFSSPKLMKKIIDMNDAKKMVWPCRFQPEKCPKYEKKNMLIFLRVTKIFCFGKNIVPFTSLNFKWSVNFTIFDWNRRIYL